MIVSRRNLFLFLLLSQPALSQSIPIKILGINDFHGQITPGRIMNNQPAGGAAVLASYLKHAAKNAESQTLIAFTGDQTGASPPVSALLNDEPTMQFFNSLGNAFCTPTYRMNPECNLVATLGNHEFDKGLDRLLTLIYGTQDSYAGANFPHISTNIVDSTSQKPIFPPYVIKTVQGVRIAFIGAILKNARETMLAKNAEGLDFLDEASSINQYIPELKAQGVTVFVVLLHEGGTQAAYEGDTVTTENVSGAIQNIVHELDDAIDVVMGGHTHQFLNAYLKNQHGKDILVTQANSYSVSFADIQLDIDAEFHMVQHKSARIINAYANQGPGLTPDAVASSIVNHAEALVSPIINTQISETKSTLTRTPNQAGETILGDLVADAYRDTMNSDIAVTNLHGIRDDIAAGVITKGHILSALPFANQVVMVSLTGSQIKELLEQQWTGHYPNILQVSGIQYSYNPSNKVGQKVIDITIQDKPIDFNKRYNIATTNFVASGSGIFTVMRQCHMVREGFSDQETVIEYIQKLNKPIDKNYEERIVLDDRALLRR